MFKLRSAIHSHYGWVQGSNKGKDIGHMKRTEKIRKSKDWFKKRHEINKLEIRCYLNKLIDIGRRILISVPY